MGSITGAISMEYNFETLTADVIYASGAKVRPTELIAYFDEATDGKVQMIRIETGPNLITLAKNDQGKWVTIAEA